MRELVKFSPFGGINNQKRIWELAPGELYQATNVDIDGALRLRRRQGYSKVIDGDCHSLYSYGSLCLAVINSDLVKINTDYTTTMLVAGLGSSTVSYAIANDIVAYTNGSVIGYIQGSTAKTFPLPTEPFKEPMVAGNMVEYYNGRFYIVIGSAFFWTDILSQRFGCIDKRQNGRQLASDITLFRAVDDGIYVSDGEAIYFAGGIDPYGMSLRLLKAYPAVRGVVCDFNGGLLKEPIPGKVLIIGTEGGICLGANSGTIFNLTEKTYDISTSQLSAVSRSSDGIDQTIISGSDKAVILSIPEMAITEYSNFAFNSMTYFNGKYLGASSGGIFEFGGNDDNGTNIDSTVQTGLTDFGTSYLKNVSDVYLGIKNEDEMSLVAVMDNMAESSMLTLFKNKDNEIFTRKVKLPLGNRSRYWGIKLTNKYGKNFEIDAMELRPKTKKVRV